MNVVFEKKECLISFSFTSKKVRCPASSVVNANGILNANPQRKGICDLEKGSLFGGEVKRPTLVEAHCECTDVICIFLMSLP